MSSVYDGFTVNTMRGVLGNFKQRSVEFVVDV